LQLKLKKRTHENEAQKSNAIDKVAPIADKVVLKVKQKPALKKTSVEGVVLQRLN